MDDVFFSQLCDQTNNTYGSALLFRGCQCSGFNFYGMPSLQFLYTVVGNTTRKQFDFSADEYLMFPHVDEQYRTTYCDNSIWNLAAELEIKNRTPGYFEEKFSNDTLGLGQVFMRKYGMFITYTDDG